MPNTKLGVKVMTVSQEHAVTLAEEFIAQIRVELRCGKFSSVRHKPRSDTDEDGAFYVEFAYAGPLVRKKATPTRDHPTVVIVNDRSGECRLMYWL